MAKKKRSRVSQKSRSKKLLSAYDKRTLIKLVLSSWGAGAVIFFLLLKHHGLI